MEHSKKHFIAIFGGSIAGSEAAYQLAKRDFRVVVFDQNSLPYGKIEDGLPLWHVKLRDKEERIIDAKLNHKNIRYIPGVKLGRDLDFEEVTRMGFSAILLATGAWKDRKLPISNEADFISKGLVYQNSFMYWFNHKHEPDYSNQTFKVKDNTLVIGGGLASLDVIKACMIELVLCALQSRGIPVTLFDLEYSIKKFLDKHDLSLEDLELSGCTLVYRRAAVDMPLSSRSRNTPEEIEKAGSISQKVLNNFVRKYLFHFEEYLSPNKGIADSNGMLKSVEFKKMKKENGKLVEIDNQFKTIDCSMAISSIGSLPEAIKGVPISGSVYQISDEPTCRIEGYDNVFAIGNAVTGRGNIQESLKHGKETTLNILEDYLAFEAARFSTHLRNKESLISENASKISDLIEGQPVKDDPVISAILKKTRNLQAKNGSNGNYLNWIESNKPVRLEEMGSD